MTGNNNPAAEEHSVAPGKRPFLPLAEFYLSREDWLMARVLEYAKAGDFTRYTSTLLEAWRLSINGLSDAFHQAAQSLAEVPELGADEAYTNDPASRFGLEEARKHRTRGISLAMFLGLFKYYRQTYLDLLTEHGADAGLPDDSALFTRRLFDRFELAFVAEWSTVPEDQVIDELQKANRAITNEKGDFLTMLESISESVIVYNSLGYPRFANLAAARVFSGEQTPGTGLYGVDSEKRLEGIPVLQELRDNHDRENVYEQVGEFHTTIYAMKERPMLDISGKFNGSLVILNDQTESVVSSRELDKKCADLTEALEELERTQHFLVQNEKMSSIGQLAAGVAHEINNPMGFINSNVHSLKSSTEGLMTLIERYEAAKPQLSADDRDALDALSDDVDLDFLKSDLPEMMDETLEGCRRVLRIVADLKDFSRSGPEKIESTNINECIESAVNVAWNQIKYKAELDRELAEVALIQCDSSQIVQVLVNMLVNAAQAIDEFGKITVSSFDEGSHVIIKIADDGVGIAEEHLTKLFDPFFTTKPVGSGTGLGLYISHQIISKHGGEVAVSSSPGKGTTFEIKLPVSRDDESPETGTDTNGELA